MAKLSVVFLQSPEYLRFELHGRLDASNAYSFSDAVSAAIRGRPEKSVVFDCGKLEYVSSAGLRALLTMRKRQGLAVKLVNVSESVRNILTISGFSQIFDVESSGGNQQ